jgi:transposase-like protein
MLSFKWRHFEKELILLAVRWYVAYSLSYRNLEEMMREYRSTGKIFEQYNRTRSPRN